MSEACKITRKRALASATRNNQRYDRKPQSIDLQPNDSVLVRNVSERGGPGKLRFWEKEIHIVLHRKDSQSPVYEVKRGSGQGLIQTLH